MKWPNRIGNRGYSTGFTWIFGLVSLFGIGLLYIVFSQVYVAHLVPAIKDQVNNTAMPIPAADITIIFAAIDKYIAFWNILPFVLFFVIVIYMIVAAIRKERESQF